VREGGREGGREGWRDGGVCDIYTRALSLPFDDELVRTGRKKEEGGREERKEGGSTECYVYLYLCVEGVEDEWVEGREAGRERGDLWR